VKYIIVPVFCFLLACLSLTGVSNSGSLRLNIPSNEVALVAMGPVGARDARSCIVGNNGKIPVEAVAGDPTVLLGVVAGDRTCTVLLGVVMVREVLFLWAVAIVLRVAS
jgi:hypothetical protein